MANVNGEKFAGSFKRPYPGSRDTDIRAEDARCDLKGEADVSEEGLLKVQQEVLELAQKVEDFRAKGPVAFAHLLEKSLSQMRASLPSIDFQVDDKPTNAVVESTGKPPSWMSVYFGEM
jgi:hypothetical protein